MRRLLILGALIAVCAATVADARPRPLLRLLDTKPLTVAGLHFRAVERVRLAVDGRTVKRVTTTRTGGFVTTLAPPTADRCLGATISAVGSSGDSATLKLPQPACPPGP